MIKKNSRIALLALSHTLISRQGITEEFFRGLLQALSAPGYRSLVGQLTDKGLLWLDRRPLGRYVGATDKGKSLLQEIYPALQSREAGLWHLIAFTQAPKADPQFRNLTEQLRKERWLRLSRGVYTHPFNPGAQVTVLLETLYSKSVVLNTVSEWRFGFERAVIVREYGLEHLSDLYSGISSEIERLLVTINQRKELNYRIFSSLSSVIARFESALVADVGLLPQVFQGSENALDVHEQIARVIQAAQAFPVAKNPRQG